MEKIKLGDFVLDTEKNKIHTIVDCETIENMDIFYTSDKKCFPRHQISKVSERNLGTIFEKLLSNQAITENENKCIKSFVSDNIDSFISITPFTNEEAIWEYVRSLDSKP